MLKCTVLTSSMSSNPSGGFFVLEVRILGMLLSFLLQRTGVDRQARPGERDGGGQGEGRSKDVGSVSECCGEAKSACYVSVIRGSLAESTRSNALACLASLDQPPDLRLRISTRQLRSFCSPPRSSPSSRQPNHIRPVGSPIFRINTL